MTEVRVKAGSSVTIKGPAVIRIEEVRSAPVPEASDAVMATPAGLGEAIALLTARRNGITIGLSGDVPPGSVTAGLAILAVNFLAHLIPADRATELLADIALAIARDDSMPPHGKGGVP
jgi:hypothetical protein